MIAMEENKKIKRNVSSNPHIRDFMNTNMIMLIVAGSLLPALSYGVYHFGFRALGVVLVSVISCMLTEFIFIRITKQGKNLKECSSLVTGMLLGMNLPVSSPLWMPAIGGVFAIAVVKMLFGGLGKNFMNPALAARCFLLISFPKLMTDFSYDGFSGATPLSELKNGTLTVSVRDMIFGNIGGTIGETSMIAIVIGGCIMIMFGVIDLYITGTYIASFAVFLLLFAGRGLDGAFLSAHLAGGGLMLGAFFMATDYVTRPVTKKGQLVYGVFLGFITAIFRCFAPSAEGVSYAIIIGNLIVPLIERVTVPKAFGVVKVKKGGAN